jgi:hypothetical protein
VVRNIRRMNFRFRFLVSLRSESTDKKKKATQRLVRYVISRKQYAETVPFYLDQKLSKKWASIRENHQLWRQFALEPKIKTSTILFQGGLFLYAPLCTVHISFFVFSFIYPFHPLARISLISPAKWSVSLASFPEKHKSSSRTRLRQKKPNVINTPLSSSSLVQHRNHNKKRNAFFYTFKITLEITRF